MAERVRAAVAAQPAMDTRPDLFVTMSLGVASDGGADVDSAALIESADRAMYRAKANGRNRVEVG